MDRISTGYAECTTEPRGDNGMEGFGRGHSYYFERWQTGTGEKIVVFTCEVGTSEPLPSKYLNHHDAHTHKERKFLEYFQIVGEQKV